MEAASLVVFAIALMNSHPTHDSTVEVYKT